ncbi:hypothetical protein [Bradyrhizobium canariense]|uniref:hypothetical protein n=1 Tax=Bradyrhizobium canariense TaxID=255045 RepID=UPI000A191233|nr:hypothetical protein [Bradyrhizobium canariense]OSI28342.1 hypothetical protein BST65_09595 [Bradyrhizobium canariense]OSI37361.1 hypothetical protein BST66_03360 [Bradyrhizobium canariense]OSI56490.1 hypothetical protein BST67_03325 [Bradyrhizobium canariense]OSI59507.1 hypothetical protein BSZ15_04440 [Bradyrhizobium canariense]
MKAAERTLEPTAACGLVSASAWRGRLLLLWVHLFVCCLSLVYVARFYGYTGAVAFTQAGLPTATLVVPLLAAIAVFFALARFSFGYFVGFYLYTLVAGYAWLGVFSKFPYDRTLSLASAIASLIAFLVPVVFITSPIKQFVVLSDAAADTLRGAILIFAAATIAAGTTYNFRLAGIDSIYGFRHTLEFPAPLRYAIGITSNALLPYAFASFVMSGERLKAAVALLLLLAFYPITLTKLTFFAPPWLLFLAIVARVFEPRATILLSLLLPISAGLLLVIPYELGAIPYELFIKYFSAVNFRMIAVPSIALDVYNDFFSTHQVTHFCQINLIKSLVGCTYSDPLSVLMSKNYELGNLNASLFATEGIASVGPLAAPLAAAVCGLVVSFGNRTSVGLPPKFIILSGGLLSQVFLNVPLTTTLVSNGALLSFVLWYVTPRPVFTAWSD